LEVIADDIDFAAPKNNAQGQQNGSKQTAGGNYASNQEPDVFEDDIPF
jgi:hypothetical protein